MNAVIETTDRNDLASAEIALREARALADAERSKILDAEQELAEAERGFEDADRAFRAGPTVTRATAKLVAEQLASNAKEALAATRDAAQDSFLAEKLATARVQYFQLVGAVQAYPETVQKTVDAIVAIEAQLRQVLSELDQTNRTYVEQLRDLNAAAGLIGMPEEPMRVQGADAVRGRVSRALTQRYGSGAVTFGEVKPLGWWLTPELQ